MATRLRAASLALALVLSVGISSAGLPAAAAAPESAGVVTEPAPARGPTYTADQRRVAQLVNDTRAANGKRRLILHPVLTRKAQQWAEHLAAINRLVHSTLTDGAPPNWLALGENVGRGRTIAIVHVAFLNQPEHRVNILGRWNRIGTGVATSASGRVFVVQVFMRI